MKILFLSYYNGVVYRGVETYVHEIARRLNAKGHTVLVCQNGEKYPNANYEVFSTGFNTKYFSGFFGLALNQLVDILRVGFFTIKCFNQMEKYDFIVATNNRLQVFFARIWTWIKNKKLIVPGQAGPGLDERIALYLFPDMYLPLSDYQMNWAKKVNRLVPMVKIHNGVDLKIFKPSNKKILTKLKSPKVLYSAALWPTMKRQHLLIRAVSKLQNVSLYLAGDGEGKIFLKNLGEKLLGERFEMNAFSYQEMPNVYPSFDLFCFPTSKWESFGIAMVEAMACGLPVVATDDPIRREIVGDAGLFVNPIKINSFSKTIKNALVKNWGDKPRKQAEKFDWDKIADLYENMFKSI